MTRMFRMHEHGTKHQAKAKSTPPASPWKGEVLAGSLVETGAYNSEQSHIVGRVVGRIREPRLSKAGQGWCFRSNYQESL